MLGLIIILLIGGLFINECVKSGIRNVAISTFWVFTAFYVFAYPFKYTLMTMLDFTIQAPVYPSEEALFFSLLLSFLFWLTVYVFRRKPNNFKTHCHILKREDKPKRNWRLWLIPSNVLLILVTCISFWFLFMLFKDGNYSLTNYYLNNSQNEARVGNGPMFLLYSIYMFAFFVSIFVLKKRPPAFFWIVLCIALINGFLEMRLLGTRRPMFMIVYALLLFFYSAKNQRIFPLIAFVPILMLILAPLGHFIKYYGVTPDAPEVYEVVEGIRQAVEVKYIFDSYWASYIVQVSGATFEGIDHLANYLDKASTTQLFFGVDYGVAWVYNSGLSLVPRAIWESKPLLYGSVAEQLFLYPEMYKSGAGQTTLPPGGIVDSLFGFGLISMFAFGYIYAKAFSVIDQILFVNKSKQGLPLLLAAVVYINMFNVLRAGTSVIMMLVMFLVFAIVIKAFDNIKLFNPSSDKSEESVT